MYIHYIPRRQNNAVYTALFASICICFGENICISIHKQAYV